MEERILNLLSLCMQAKQKGHDVFFELNPHVSNIRIKSYMNGWKSECNTEGKPVYDFSDRKFLLYYDDGKDEEMYSETEAYLKGLIGA